MTVAELIEMLSEMPADAEIRLATQPGWPMEYRVAPTVFADADCDADATVVYLAEAEQIGYLPEFASESLRANGWNA
jgi:hypothetical protein